MTIVSVDRVQIGATASDKQDAIRQAGELLVWGGCVAPNYVNGMLAREQTMSTYLGNGVAIPHGQHENLSDVHNTGISVLQLPDGVQWEDDERAYLVIGIAANAEEHVGVLANLAEVIEDEEASFEHIVANVLGLSIAHRPKAGLGDVSDRVPKEIRVTELEDVRARELHTHRRNLVEQPGQVPVGLRVIVTPHRAAPPAKSPAETGLVTNACKSELPPILRIRHGFLYIAPPSAASPLAPLDLGIQPSLCGDRG